jgi:arginine decarboxylase-like protein
MELWIKTQTKLGLYKVDNVYIDERNFGNDDIQYYIQTNMTVLGKYKTKEKALEILNEIQKILQPKYVLNGSSIKPIGDSWVEHGIVMQQYNASAKIEELSTYVYSMPEEE